MNKLTHGGDELPSVRLPDRRGNIINLQPAFLLIPSQCSEGQTAGFVNKKKHLTYEQRELSDPEPTATAPGKNKLQQRKRNRGPLPRERERNERRLIRVSQFTETL